MNVKPRKVEVVSKIFQDIRNRKNKTQLIAEVVAVVVILLAIAFLVAGCSLIGVPKAHAEDKTVVECKYFVSKGNNTEYSPVFIMPVDAEKGFLFHLENGFSNTQKQILFENAKKFYQGKDNQGYTAVGMICTDPNGSGKVSVIMEK